MVDLEKWRYYENEREEDDLASGGACGGKGKE
jgi:hypothetical protein